MGMFVMRLSNYIYILYRDKRDFQFILCTKCPIMGLLVQIVLFFREGISEEEPAGSLQKLLPTPQGSPEMLP